jgi:hypothetical protein
MQAYGVHAPLAYPTHRQDVCGAVAFEALAKKAVLALDRR